MINKILSILLLISPSYSFGQLKLDLNDSTTYQAGFETSFDINYQDTFVYFDSSTTETFNKIVNFHKDNPSFVLELGIHQDPLGSERGNLKQSQYRAMRIIEVLQKNYDVDIQKFIVIGYGESDPILKFEEIDDYRYDKHNNLVQNIANLNRRLTLKILKIN